MVEGESSDDNDVGQWQTASLQVKHLFWTRKGNLKDSSEKEKISTFQCINFLFGKAIPGLRVGKKTAYQQGISKHHFNFKEKKVQNIFHPKLRGFA